ncbi:sensor histidine kinase [Taibaiella koreensis]|uniref:sensor histidine kinase n=1 Tax=Taibaiella koreensis TaxID=1268548 RepID=UPI0013C35769|nr:HAMP domain-containing sensor histidine kinase [Taibaiella koreensis]
MATDHTPDYMRLMQKMTDVIAHDVRNPLNNILLSTAQFKLDSLPDKEDTAFYVDIIERNCDRIHALLAEITAVIHMQGLTPGTFDLTEMIRELLEEQSERLELKQITCMPSLNEVIVSRFDREKLKSALGKLLDNALEAMNGGGILKVAASEQDDEICLLVGDSGEGIPPEVLPHIFAPFFTTRERNRGLGLAWVKNIIEAHQGRVAVETGTDGSRFMLFLPKPVI